MTLVVKNKIEETLKEKGIMKGWLADKAGIHRNTLKKIMNGADPHLSVAKRIAKVLGKTIDEIWPDLD